MGSTLISILLGAALLFLIVFALIVPFLIIAKVKADERNDDWLDRQW